MSDSSRAADPWRWPIVVAGISGAVAVMVGAFGAHYLERFLVGRGLDAATVARYAEITDTAVRYHLIHTVALLGLLPLRGLGGGRLCRVVAGLMVAGIVLFSGSLYLLVLLDQRWLGAITPLGGTAWVVAWVLVAVIGARLGSGGDQVA